MNEENSQKNLAEEKAHDEFSESSSSTDYDCLDSERIQRQHSFAWKYEDKNKMHQTKELDGDSEKKLTVMKLQVKEHLNTQK